MRISMLALIVVGFLQLSARADFPPEWDRRAATENGWIYDDFEAGVAEAKKTGRPLMVVLRCPP